MPVNNQELFKALEIVASQEKLYITVKSSIKGGIIAGISATAGGIILGPIGLAIGATIGGVVAAKSSENFQPLTEIIQKEISPAQRDQFYNHIMKGFEDVGIHDALEIAKLIIQGGYEYQIALMLMRSFFEENMNMRLTSK